MYACTHSKILDLGSPSCTVGGGPPKSLSLESCPHMQAAARRRGPSLLAQLLRARYFLFREIEGTAASSIFVPCSCPVYNARATPATAMAARAMPVSRGALARCVLLEAAPAVLPEEAPVVVEDVECVGAAAA